MTRRRYLIAYDISDPARLRRVCNLMKDFGTRLQYSVFLCDLSEMEIAQWRAKIHTTIALSVDSVIQVDLGALGAASSIVTIGVPRRLPPDNRSVVL